VPRIALRDIHKRFGAAEALRGATLELEPAEVHALLGENGAGKTTLVRVLYGIHAPDAGSLEIDGRPVRLRGPRHALGLGIGLVHQHFMGVEALSVAENLALGEAGPPLLRRARLRARAREVLARWELDVDPDAPAGSLAVGQLQRLEIASALERGARVLVLDEPTAVLAPTEVDHLLALLARLRAEGRTVVFISHKLEEITAVCDRVTVLRAGRSVATRPVAGLTAEQLGRWMVGEAPAGEPAAPPPAEDGGAAELGGPAGTPLGGARAGAVALELRGLRAPGLRGIELEVRAGELVALAGIDGNGQGPLEELLAGVRAPDAGELRVARPPLALISGDRQRTGLVLDLSVAENLVLADAARGGAPPAFRHGWLDAAALARSAAETIDRFQIQAAPAQPARALSGGNQQKLCIARALRARPGVLVAVNPTRGLDVRSTRAVRARLRRLARAGTAVLLISTDLDEVLELGDRLAVMFRGALLPAPVGERSRGALARLMLGEAA
jgi:simple sugar transport system ATP-binding protein